MEAMFIMFIHTHLCYIMGKRTNPKMNSSKMSEDIEKIKFIRYKATEIIVY